MGEQLCVIAMIRNEADVLPAFLSHIRTLFDKAMVIDHRSTDGSRAILDVVQAEWPSLEIYEYGFQGYFQGALSTAFAHRAFDNGADWVFFLDADEFLDFPDRASVASALAEHPGAACSFLWRNLAPTSFGSYARFDLDQEFRVGEGPSRYGKVALSRRILDEAPGFQMALGNHTVLPAPCMPALETAVAGEILHIPIRSRDRLATKLEAGVAAYLAKTDSQTVEGFHWFELLERVRAGTAGDDFISTVALNYGERLAELPTTPRAAVRRHISPAGVAEARVPTGADGRGLARSRAETERLDRVVPWRQLHASLEEEVFVLIGEGNQVSLRPRVMRPAGEPAPDMFVSLPSENDPRVDELSAPHLVTAIELAFTPIETPVPSAWSHLAPVMLGLIALLRPRRFVELGSHYGCSFFAACQAMEALELNAEAIAIDTWRGDPQAGHYTDEVFENFTYLLRSRYPKRSHYIRSRFEDAVGCFEDGSIDLLHIDGLHTYDAVQVDFETWLPKMSDCGVIIMHDTTVYERGFGVWQLWHDIEARFPTLNLLHGHGLGIVYVGTRQGRFAEMLRALASDRTRYLILNALVCGLGELSIGAAQTPSANAEPEQAHIELEAARTEIALARAELSAVHASTSWRVSAPIRVLGRILGGGRRG